MATQSEKIQIIKNELSSLKKTLTQYENMFSADGIIDSTEQVKLNEMQSVITKAEAKLAVLEQKESSKEKSLAKEPAGCSPEKTERIRQQYERMIANAGIIGPVAADNLQRFIDGVGGTKQIDVSWLRGFSDIKDAESRILGYTEGDKNLQKWAKEIKNNEETTKTDYWDADITEYSILSELSYASGASDILGNVSMDLSRTNDIVSISGAVDINWSDAYNWNKGMSFYVPGSGTISDDDGLYLKKCGGAKDFNMEAKWTFTYSGAYDAKTGNWTKNEWRINGSVYEPSHGEIDTDSRN